MSVTHGFASVSLGVCKQVIARWWPDKGKAMKRADLWRIKMWFSPPRKSPRPVERPSEGEGNLEWVMEEGTVNGKTSTKPSHVVYTDTHAPIQCDFVVPPTKRQSPLLQARNLDLLMCSG